MAKLLFSKISLFIVVIGQIKLDEIQ